MTGNDRLCYAVANILMALFGSRFLLTACLLPYRNILKLTVLKHFCADGFRVFQDEPMSTEHEGSLNGVM